MELDVLSWIPIQKIHVPHDSNHFLRSALHLALGAIVVGHILCDLLCESSSTCKPHDQTHGDAERSDVNAGVLPPGAVLEEDHEQRCPL